jgi:hypothetical protein
MYDKTKLLTKIQESKNREQGTGGVAECKYDFPHPQPFSPRRRELESASLALWERVRVRAVWQFISLFSNAQGTGNNGD